MSILALRHIQVAPDYRVSIVTVRDREHRIKKLRIHRRKIKQHFRTILAQLSLPRTIRLRYKLR